MLNGKRNSKELGLHWNSEISSNEHESHLQQLYNENLYPAFDTQRMWSSSNFQFEEPEKHFDLESVPFLSFQINEIMSERLYATPSPSIASVEDFFDQNRASPTSDKGLIPLSPRISEHVQSSDLTGILITSFQINKSDVLCGKGGANLHPGNIFFRNLVIHYHHAYLMANSADKENKIVQTILFEVKRAGGRFLRCLSPFWSDIGERAAAAKTRQALREREPPAGSSVPPLPETTLKKLVSLKEGKFRFHVPSKQNSTSFDEIAVYDNDVLFGRGGIQDSHAGNKRFRILIRQNQHAYFHSRKLEKTEVAKAIVSEITSSGGRFLNLKMGRWVELSAEKAREKTSLSLRASLAQENVS